MNNSHNEQKLSVGDRITLGSWPQGADGRVEPIRWQDTGGAGGPGAGAVRIRAGCAPVP